MHCNTMPRVRAHQVVPAQVEAKMVPKDDTRGWNSKQVRRWVEGPVWGSLPCPRTAVGPGGDRRSRHPSASSWAAPRAGGGVGGGGAGAPSATRGRHAAAGGAGAPAWRSPRADAADT